MKKILSISLGAVLLGAAFVAVQPVAAWAQQTSNPAVDPTVNQVEPVSIPAYDPSANRDAQLQQSQADRAAQAGQQALSAADRQLQLQQAQAQRNAENARRAQQLDQYREDEEDSTSNRAFGRDVGMVLGNFIDREIEGAVADQMRLEEQMQRDADWQDQRELEQNQRQQDRQQQAQERAQNAQERGQDSQANRDIRAMDSEARGQARTQANSAQSQARQQAQSAQTPRRTVAASTYQAVQLTTAAKISDAVNNFGKNLTRFPSLFYILSYTAGVFFMAMALVKANRTINEPSRNPLSDAVKYAGAGVFLSALPVTTSILQSSLGWQNGSTLALNYRGMSATGNGAATPAQGLDQFMVNLMKDVTEPMLSIVALFGFVAGVFLLFTGLQRLTKGVQEGPKGPAGLGTLMTFAMGSALIAFIPALKVVLNSVFGTDSVVSYPSMTRLAAQIGATDAQMVQATVVTTSLLAFLTIVGVISFARGLFMLKDTADGAQNASLMGSMSHLIAGVCCVNFGAFANMLQNTLGLTNFGIAFTQ